MLCFRYMFTEWAQKMNRIYFPALQNVVLPIYSCFLVIYASGNKYISIIYDLLE